MSYNVALAEPQSHNLAEVAQAQPIQDSPDTELSAVIVNSHYDNAVGTSDAASQGVIRGELLQDIPLLRPGEALETVPGLVVTQHSGDGKANQYFLRGYNLDHGTDFALSVDGVPVNMPTNAHGQGYADLNFLIPELVDRINYRKGPYFADNGNFSSAGSADSEYRKSLDYNIASLTAGSYGYVRALLTGSTILKLPGQVDSIFGTTGPTVLGAFEYQHTDGPWTIKESLNKYNGFLRLSDGDRANGWSIDGILYNASWNATDQVPLSLIQSGQLGRFSALSPTDGGNTGREILSGEWHSSDDNGFTKASAYAEHYNLQLWSDFTYFEFRPSAGDQFEQEESRNIIGGQVVKGWNHNLFGNDSTTELGVQLRHDNINVSLQNTVSRVPYATILDDQVSETTTGLFLQNTTIWNAWLRTLVGMRDDNIFMDMTSRTLAQNTGTASGNQISPKLSVILGPWDKTEFFANAGRGFHSNDARGVIDKIDPTTDGPAGKVPPLVSSFGEEVGVRTEIIKGLQSSLAFWSLNSNSELVYSTDSAIGSSEPNGASKRYGVEWNNHWIPNNWLLLDADLAWTHARYATMNDNGDTGNLIPNAVGKVGLFRATLHNFETWSVGAELRYIGRSPLTQDGSLTAPSSFVTNVQVKDQISPKVALTIEALNLFNRKYYDIAYAQDYQITPTSATVPSGITVHPGEPLEFRVTLALKF
jgi:hypothetical protein